MPGFECINHEEAEAVSKVFEEGGVLFAHGFDNRRKKYHVREFEKEASFYFKSKYCLAVNSGTAAIKCALKALGVKKDDEVITQGFNFIATIEAILDCGAIPIICNIDNNLHLDINDCQSKITKNTKAIICVHMLGMGGPVKELKALSKKNNIPVIEDACEAVGAMHENKFFGTLFDIGVFSFDHGKNITCGEGGMVLTNNEKIYKFIASYSDHGHALEKNIPRGQDKAIMPGFNYRMTELQAAVGKVQLTKLEKIIQEHSLRYSILENKLSKKFQIRKEIKGNKGSEDTFIITDLKTTLQKEFLTKLKNHNIGTKNLPDAMRWHCSNFWSHALEKNQINNSQKTYKTLQNCIAIPILISIPKENYLKLAEDLSTISC